MFNYVDLSEKHILDNTKKKIKKSFVIIADKKDSFLRGLLKSIDNRITIVSSADGLKAKYIDAALIYGELLDLNANLKINKTNKKIIKKIKDMKIPIYCYTHSFNIKHRMGKSNRIGPDQITSIISEIGVFEPEIFVQEANLKYNIF